MQLNLTKSRDDKLLQDLLDKKLRVIVIFEDDYLNHIARIAYKDIQQDNYTYRIGEYNIYKGEEWGFCDFCKRHDCYFIVPNDTLEGSERPEPYNPVYDEAYLNEKIKKATESWKGVYVDAMLAECRGHDEEKSEKPMNPDGLEEEIDRLWESFADEMEGPHNLFDIYARLARHFAQWGADHTPLPEDTVLFNKGVAEGKRLMMEEAVEGYVNYYEDSGGILMAEAQVGCPYHNGDKVRVIVLKNED